MKNKLFALGFAALFMVSCSDDDKDAIIRKGELTKRWYPAAYRIGSEVIPYIHHDCNSDYIQFDHDTDTNERTFTQVEYTSTCTTADADITEGEYSVSGNRITITVGSESISGTIKELTENKLVVSSKYDFDGDGDEETVNEIYASAP